MRLRELFAIALVIGSTGCHKSTSSPAEDRVRFQSEEFVHTSLAFQPSIATAQGYHQHRGVALDEQLDDYSSANLDRVRQFLRLTLEHADRLSSRKLPP